MTPFEQSSPPHKTTRNQVNLGMMDVSGAVESLPGMTGYFPGRNPFQQQERKEPKVSLHQWLHLRASNRV